MLSHCRSPFFGSNQGLSQEIPTEIARLTQLSSLQLDSNNLRGLLTELGLLTKLSSLQLYSNNLTGRLPTELGLLTELTSLAVYRNDLTGPIPSEIGNLRSLQNLNIHENEKLDGEVPQSVCDLQTYSSSSSYYSSGRLESLELFVTNLSCPKDCDCGFQDIASDYIELVEYDMETPDILFGLPLDELMTRTSLDLQGAGLYGSIPSNVGLLTNIRSLDLAGNFFTGSAI